MLINMLKFEFVLETSVFEILNYTLVDFKSHYSKIKRSKNGYFQHLFKNESFEIFAFKAELKLVDLEINKGINDEYLWVLHGSDVELHVGGADKQECRAEYLRHHHKGVKRLPVSEL